MKGTGAGGRITKQDVEAYMSRKPRGTQRCAAAPPPPRRRSGSDRTPAAPLRRRRLPFRADSAKTRIEPMSTMRQKIAEHMVLSKRTSAHVTTVHKVDMTKSPSCATGQRRSSRPATASR